MRSPWSMPRWILTSRDWTIRIRICGVAGSRRRPLPTLGSATVRAVTELRALTVDKKILLKKIHEDPSLALRIMQTMSRRIQDLNTQLMSLQTRAV